MCSSGKKLFALTVLNFEILKLHELKFSFIEKKFSEKLKNFTEIFKNFLYMEIFEKNLF